MKARKQKRIFDREEKKYRAEVGEEHYQLMRVNRASKLTSPAGESLHSPPNSKKANILEVIMKEGKKTDKNMEDKMQQYDDAFYN